MLRSQHPEASTTFLQFLHSPPIPNTKDKQKLTPPCPSTGPSPAAAPPTSPLPEILQQHYHQRRPAAAAQLIPSIPDPNEQHLCTSCQLATERGVLTALRAIRSYHDGVLIRQSALDSIFAALYRRPTRRRYRSLGPPRRVGAVLRGRVHPPPRDRPRAMVAEGAGGAGAAF
ncbi:Uu.00g033210.m01.CDS01 [Anthostomella pinea]|uniref:Uu.00g033210.m01.CDS01 n=1 Tax=Anthostomella pinea TaxID=933095 RepID=A0AAI8V3Y4_9PEZI|nr:Uu.00g033210.m01.CDS01 [Anthostomella pinea]